MKKIATTLSLALLSTLVWAQCDTLLADTWNVTDKCTSANGSYTYKVVISSQGDSANVLMKGFGSAAFVAPVKFSYNCTTDIIKIPLQDPDKDGGYIVGSGMYVWQKDKIIFSYGYTSGNGKSDSCSAELVRAPQGFNVLNKNKIQTSVLPNPFNETAKIMLSGFTSTNNVIFTVYDILGKQVYSNAQNASSNELSISKKQLGSGIFFYSISNALGESSMGRMIVE